MKHLKLLTLFGLFLFVTIQNSLATNIEYLYSDREIANDETTLELSLKFSNLSERVKKLLSAGIRVRFWNDPQCKDEIKGINYVTQSPSCFQTLYDIKMSSLPFEENMRKKYGNNYIGPVRVYFSVDIIEYTTGRNNTGVVAGTSYRIIESFKPRPETTKIPNLNFNYRYIIPVVKENYASSFTISYPSGRYTKDNPITKLDTFKVVVSFWKDSKRNVPLIFYTSSSRKTRYNNPEVFAKIPEEQDIKRGETFFETNELERTRTDWESFVISDLPTNFLYEIGVPFLKCGKKYSDRIYIFADVYSKDGKLLNHSNYWWQRNRYIVGPPCYHRFESSENVHYENRVAGCYILKMKVIEHLNVCQLCGHTSKRKHSFIERKYRNPNAPASCKDKQETKEEEGGGEDNNHSDCNNEANLFISYEEERKESPLPPQYKINRTKVDRDLFKIDLETDQKEKVGSYTEVEWEQAPPCYPHDMKTDGGMSAKCSKCGIVDYINAETFDNMPAEQCKDELSFDINGVKLVMRLIKGIDGDDPLYVAETETTQGLWATVFPNDWHGWDKESEFPASNLPYEDVGIFIDNLNHLADKNKWPVHFMIPTALDWIYAYKYGGMTKEGWNADNSYNSLHPVRSFEPSSKGIYDMNGNVQEMTSDIRRAEQKEYTDPLDVRALLQKDWEMAVCGNGIYDPCGSVDLTKERWMGIGMSKDLGVRIFAIPVKR